MKSLTRFALCLAALLPVACGSIASFDVDFPADAAIEGAQSPAFPAYQSVGSTMSQTMSSKGVSSFKSMKLSSGSLTITPNSSLDMGVVQSFKVEVSAPGLPTTVIAHQESEELSRSKTVFPLTIEDVELKPYFQSSDVTFTATPTTSRRPNFPISLHIDLKARVQVL